MMTRCHNNDSEFTVAIVGGGFSGTILAAQLLRISGPLFSVAVIEKSSFVGRGLAYGTDCQSLLLNVRARNMSAFPDDPHHFLRWARANYDAGIGPGSFAPRAVYGHYVKSVLDDAVLSSGTERLRWIQGEAVSLDSDLEKTVIRLDNGDSVRAGRVVLALGNFPPCDPLVKWNIEKNSHYFCNPWIPEACRNTESFENILLVGSGLTAVDIAIALRAQRCQAKIHILSRHGLLPQTHKPTDACASFWNGSSPKTTRGLLRLIRQQVEESARNGAEWTSVIDSLRPQVAEIWQSLPEAERRRFLRHARCLWEIHRHRMAPEIGERIATEIFNNKIQLHTGRITNCQENTQGMAVRYRDRKTGKEDSLSVDRVINCTGPGSNFARLQNPLVSLLLTSGRARPDALFLGLDVSPGGALIQRDGKESESYFVVGPARKGSLWESTAVPEIRVQIQQLAEHLVNLRAVQTSAVRHTTESLSSQLEMATNL